MYYCDWRARDDKSNNTTKDYIIHKNKYLTGIYLFIYMLLEFELSALCLLGRHSAS
jgi:hypothetical protein